MYKLYPEKIAINNGRVLSYIKKNKVDVENFSVKDFVDSVYTSSDFKSLKQLESLINKSSKIIGYNNTFKNEIENGAYIYPKFVLRLFIASQMDEGVRELFDDFIRNGGDFETTKLLLSAKPSAKVSQEEIDVLKKVYGKLYAKALYVVTPYQINEYNQVALNNIKEKMHEVKHDVGVYAKYSNKYDFDKDMLERVEKSKSQIEDVENIVWVKAEIEKYEKVNKASESAEVCLEK